MMGCDTDTPKASSENRTNQTVNQYKFAVDSIETSVNSSSSPSENIKTEYSLIDNANLLSDGHLIRSGNKIYMSAGNYPTGIYELNLDNSVIKNVYSESGRFLQISGDDLFFSQGGYIQRLSLKNGRLYEVYHSQDLENAVGVAPEIDTNLDDEAETEAETNLRFEVEGAYEARLQANNISWLSIVNEVIYFYQGYQLNKINLDGSNLEKIFNDEVYNMNFSNGYVFYRKEIANQTNKRYILTIWLLDKQRFLRILRNISSIQQEQLDKSLKTP